MSSSKAVLLIALVALAWPASAGAHKGGKAEPRISAGVSANQGLVRVLTVRLTDVDSEVPVRGATVLARAEMTSPHVMRSAEWPLAETSAGVYGARVKFLMPAAWTVSIGVSGERVVAARSRLPVQIERGTGSPPPPAAGIPDLTALPTELEDSLGQRDLVTMAVLWLHATAAFGWILGVVVMAIALPTPPRLLADGPRARLAGAYRQWGAWVHWGFVPVIAWTGIYNMLYVTPFPIAWRPSQFAQLADVPYGPLYEAILVIKLGLFAALLITGTQVLLRTVRPATVPASNPAPGFIRGLGAALGPPGIVYAATVPLIVAAAMALRYVHILSHVADVLATQ